MTRSSRAIDSVLVPRSQHYKSPFGRIFRTLPAWQPPSNDPVKAEAEMRAFAQSAMSESDIQSQADNTNLPAGYTYFGQFVDHDITFDPTSSLQRQNDPEKLHNFRTPRLDLDCLYGEGPEDEPFMYDQKRKGMFLIGKVHNFADDGSLIEITNEPDLPRNAQGSALIGDKRNDENVIVSQFQLSMLRLHNAIYGELIGQDYNDLDAEFNFDLHAFEEAQRILRWFYQYVVWNDYVGRLVADRILNAVLPKEDGLLVYKGRFYNWSDDPFIPIEFAVAAYRYGHTLVRPGYQVNLNSDVGLGFGTELPIFAGPGGGQDLSGFKFMPQKHTVQWDWYFDFQTGGGFPQLARRIDPALSPAVAHIPDGKGGSNPLAALNLLRSWRMGIPKGTDVAKAMGVKPMAISDPHGYVRNHPNWTPAEEPALMALLPTGHEGHGGPGKWEVADLLRAAGAPIDPTDVSNTINDGHN